MEGVVAGSRAIESFFNRGSSERRLFAASFTAVAAVELGAVSKLKAAGAQRHQAHQLHTAAGFVHKEGPVGLRALWSTSLQAAALQTFGPSRIRRGGPGRGRFPLQVKRRD